MRVPPAPEGQAALSGEVREIRSPNSSLSAAESQALRLFSDPHAWRIDFYRRRSAAAALRGDAETARRLAAHLDALINGEGAA